MAVDPLDTVNRKLARAREHRDALDAEIRAYVESGPYAVTKHVNDERTRWSVSVALLREPDVGRWGVIFGDSIHNIRSALDHLFFALARHYDAGRSTPSARKKWKFPIQADRAAFEGFRSKLGQIFPAEVWAAIEREQPYHGGNEDEIRWNYLALLQRLDNADKHHEVHILTTPRSEMSWSNLGGARGSFSIEIDSQFMTGFARIDPSAEISVVTVEESSPDMNPEFKLATFVALAEIPGVGILRFLDLVALRATEVIRLVAGAAS